MQITQDEMEDLVRKERVQFYAHVMFLLNNMGTAITRQVFYMYTLYKYKGVSNSGCQLLKTLGMGMSRKTYESIKSEVYDTALQHNK